MKNPVVQMDRTGCGIAACAALSDRSYREMKAIADTLGISVTDDLLWSEPAYIRKLLERVGLKAAPGELPFHSWESLPDLALLSVKWHQVKGRPFWHWVVFVREKGQAFVLDSKKSLRTHRRTDFGRMKPRWYIRVTTLNMEHETKLS